jgi:NAD(P)-dependent dehydrogenase (short-subunit alcohol dehydrogenase family)
MELDGARVLVTAGSRRLGAEIAVDLAAHGAQVAISYRTSGADAEETLARLARQSSRTGRAIRADLADPADAGRVVHEAAAALGGLDAVIHCASAGFRAAALADITPELYEEATGATLRGGLFVAQAAAAVLADGGAIVFIGDVAGIAGWSAFLPHSAAKGALRPLVRALARSLGPRLRVNIVHPGTVLLPAGEEAPELVATLPLRAVGSAADIAGAVRYLLEARYVTGAELVVDGGRLTL